MGSEMCIRDRYYSCGLLIHQAIDLALQKNGDKDIYSLWVEFRRLVEKSDEKKSEVFLSHTEKSTSADLVRRIKDVIENGLRHSEEALNLHL